MNETMPVRLWQRSVKSMSTQVAASASVPGDAKKDSFQ